MNTTLSLSKKPVLLPYQPRALLPYEEMTDAEIFNGSGDLIFDSECYPNFFLVAFRHVATDKIVKLIPPFDARKLSYILHRYRCIGFNSIKYDLPLLWAAYKNQDAQWLKQVSNRLVSDSWPQEVMNEFDFKVFPTSNIDLIEVCPNQGSLKLYAARIHVVRLQEIPYHHMKELSDFEKEIVTDYCVNGDLPATEALFQFNKERLELRSYLGQIYKEDLMSKSDAQMAETIVRSEIKKKTGKWPKRPSYDETYSFKYKLPAYLNFRLPQLHQLLRSICECTFTLNDYGFINIPELFKDCKIQIGDFSATVGIGGLHSNEKCVAYKSDNEYMIVDKDVASYYPRIITNLKLTPEGLGDVFLTVYNKLMVDRLDAKKRKQFAADKGLKIAINGASGKFNSEYSVMWSPRCYVQMTLTGQLSILMLIEMISAIGMQVISANTDGIVIYCPRMKYDELEQVVKEWEKATQYETEETRYLSYYARDVNAYFALKEDKSVKVKGPYSEVGSQTGTQLDNNPIMLICSDAIKKLLAEGTPIEETIKGCTNLTRFITVRNVKGGAHKNGHYLGKVVRWYYGKGEYGTINYVESGNKVAETEGAIPVMDLPKSFPTNLDHDRYIKETRSILYDIGYLQRPKQVKFF